MKYNMDNIRKSLRQNLLKERRRISPEVEDIDITMGTRQDEEITLVLHDINQLNQRVQYLTSLNTDLIEFLHTLVKTLDHNNDIDISDARKDFTVLLNRSGRRKFYQQTKRL